MSAWGWGALAAVSLGAAAGWARQRWRLERVARATHELRTPLTSARLALHSAGRARGWAPLAPVDNELARAALALDDLESARRGRRPARRIEPVDAATLVRDVRDRWAPLAWPVGRELRIDDPAAPPSLVVHGHQPHLAQALGNLVGNALEHGSGAVVLRVRAGEGERPGRQLWRETLRRERESVRRARKPLVARFEVEDAGPGLPASLPRLRRHRWGGHGTRGRGLAIAAEIARRHHGSVREEQIPGGFRMVLELPAVDARAISGRAVGPRAPDANPTEGLRVGGVARPRIVSGVGPQAQRSRR